MWEYLNTGQMANGSPPPYLSSIGELASLPITREYPLLSVWDIHIMGSGIHIQIQRNLHTTKPVYLKAIKEC